MRLEAKKLRAGDIAIVVESWRRLREMNLTLEALVHKEAKGGG